MPGLYRINENMELVLTQVIKDISGASDVMWGMQGAFVEDTAGVIPKFKDFISLSIISGPTPLSGIEYTPVPGQTGIFRLSRNHEFTLSVNLYTNNAHLYKIAKIPMLIRSESYRNRLRAVGLGLMRESNTTDLSEFDETRFNLRSHIDLIFSYIEIEENVNVGEIESYHATGTLGDNNIVVDVNKSQSP